MISSRVLLFRASLVSAAFASLACGAATKRASDESDGDAGSDVSVDGSMDVRSPDADAADRDADSPPCKGLACKRVACGPGLITSVSGVVYAPNGKLPVYDVIVYVPNAPLDPAPKGAACDRCGATPSGEPLVTALSDAKGRFRLDDVPVGFDIPLVLQLGKWRRQVTIPAVKACTDNPLDPSIARLPRRRSEGDMPRIAVTVGGCDKLACMLPKIGIDASEFGVDGSPAAVHFYKPEGSSVADGPPGMKDARVLWSDLAKLKQYDLAIFSCECYEAPASKDAASFKAVTDYLAAGGRILTTDFQYVWYKLSPDKALSSVAVIPGGAPQGDNPVKFDTGFPKGKALADWIKAVDPVATYGEAKCDYVFNNLQSADKSRSRTWASSDSTGSSGEAGPGIHPRFLTINTPVGRPIEEQCGKAVHLDAHINQTDTIGTSYPAGCVAPILQGEEAFAFMFFDLFSCLQNDSSSPKPPPAAP